jgi:hemoglobin-like flavoprotein
MCKTGNSQAIYSKDKKDYFILIFDFYLSDLSTYVSLNKCMENIWRKKNKLVTLEDDFKNILMELTADDIEEIKSDEILNEVPDNWEDDYIVLMKQEIEKGNTLFYHLDNDF